MGGRRWLLDEGGERLCQVKENSELTTVFDTTVHFKSAPH
jgi:hypothetical protein